MYNSLYILNVTDNGEQYPYEYSNLKHAEEHYDFEKSCILLEYINGAYHFVKGK